MTVIQFAGIPAGMLVLLDVWRDVDWPVLPWLLLPALVGLAPGVALVRTLPEAVLQIVIGLLVIIALAATLVSERARVFKGRKGAASAGLLSGFMNAAAGVGGPAMVLYRVSVNWPQRPFVATLQVYFIALSTATIAARGMPHTPTSGWVAGGIGLLIGLVLGDLLARRVSEHTARTLTIVVAVLGARHGREGRHLPLRCHAEAVASEAEHAEAGTRRGGARDAGGLGWRRERDPRRTGKGRRRSDARCRGHHGGAWHHLGDRLR